MEDEDTGPLQIVVKDLDIGDDLCQGIQDIEGARVLLTHSRHLVAQLKYSATLRGRLSRLIDDQRDYLSRRLQHFLNMILIPHPSIGLGKTKVRLLFNCALMRDRTFTVSSMPKDRNNFSQRSSVSLQSLQKVVATISETTCAIMDFAEALSAVEFEKEESIFLKPILKKVLD